MKERERAKHIYMCVCVNEINGKRKEGSGKNQRKPLFVVVELSV